MNRRVLAFIVAAALLCFLAAQAFGDLPIFPNKAPRQMYFRIVTHGGDDPYWAVVHQGMLDACKELGIKADMDFCGGDLALQLKRFKEAVAMGCDGIGRWPRPWPRASRWSPWTPTTPRASGATGGWPSSARTSATPGA
jgi:ABC-type sugar transport system substrate-binding protein